jgi:hypothetical protein
MNRATGILLVLTLFAVLFFWGISCGGTPPATASVDAGAMFQCVIYRLDCDPTGECHRECAR